jgi:thioredoxin 1
MSANAPVNLVQLTSENFAQEVLHSGVPVVVDFWAAWCGPCRVVGPIVEALAAQFVGQAKVAKLNIDDYPEIASQYNIHAVPTLLFFQNGQVVAEVVGVLSQRQLAAKLEALLEGDRPAVPAA